MILGVGVDTVELARIAQSLADTGDAFARRVLAPVEFDEWVERKRTAAFVAKRWAIKEAFFKACGTGMRAPLTWHAVWVTHTALGAPQISVAPQVQNWLFERKISHWYVSVSDEKTHAIAFAVVEARES